MLKWILLGLLVLLIAGLYFYTDQTKNVIDMIIKWFN